MLPNLVGHNILCQDFFDDALELPNDFDLVVGNPPWARGSEETLAERWCKQECLPMSQKQLAYGFIAFTSLVKYRFVSPPKAGKQIYILRLLEKRYIWKAPRHIKDNGLVCFLLPSSILLNHQTKALEGFCCMNNKRKENGDS